MSLEWAEKVRNLRKRLGLTQKELADLLDTVFQVIGAWERTVTEPTLCYQRILQFLDDCTSSAIQFLQQRPWENETGSSWKDKLEDILERLDWSQRQLAQFLGVTDATIGGWLNEEYPPQTCYQILVALLESIADTDPKAWPSGLHVETRDVITSERIKLLRLALGLTQVKFGNILHVNFSTVSKWEVGGNPPEWASNLLLKVMETYPRAVELIERIPWNDEQISGERAAKIRQSLGANTLELAKLLGGNETTLDVYERRGIPASSPVLVYLLLEKYPEEFISYIEGLSSPGGHACPVW